MSLQDDKHKAMVMAITMGELWRVEELIKDGINLDHSPHENSGFYLKLSAGLNDHGNDVMRILLEAGANPNIHLISEGSTALSISTLKGNVDAVRILLEAGADVRVRLLNENTIMHKAVHSSIEIIDLLEAYGASVNTPNALGSLPFDILIKSWSGDKSRWKDSIARRLVLLGADYSPAVFDDFKYEDAEFLRTAISQYRLEYAAQTIPVVARKQRTVAL